MFYLILIAVSLLCRTYADVYMIITATGIEALVYRFRMRYGYSIAVDFRAIISRDKLQFLMNVVKYGLAMPAISVTNAILKASGHFTRKHRTLKIV